MENVNVRAYKPGDYAQIAMLYRDFATFGGQFDENRDSRERLDALIEKNSKAILVGEVNGEISGTVTLFEDGRSCWLYRFAVKDGDKKVFAALLKEAKVIAQALGHGQFLVYAPAGSTDFESRYLGAGFHKGNDYTCYWMDLH